jgi:hypothetical protein
MVPGEKEEDDKVDKGDELDEEGVVDEEDEEEDDITFLLFFFFFFFFHGKGLGPVALICRQNRPRGPPLGGLLSATSCPIP